jgi:hypothetical protein
MVRRVKAGPLIGGIVQELQGQWESVAVYRSSLEMTSGVSARRAGKLRSIRFVHFF